jgi:hypothetical protein
VIAKILVILIRKWKTLISSVKAQAFALSVLAAGGNRKTPPKESIVWNLNVVDNNLE